MIKAAVLAAALASQLVSALNTTLIQEYAGQSFFDTWTFNASVIDNTTYGNIHYLSREASTAAGLTYVNTAGNAIIKVDNTTSGANDPTFGRNSIKLVSNASYSLGTLFIIDAVHLPYGCSVWPAIWTLSSVTKDDEGGEIDIWESVNQMQNAQYTLHTRAGCTQSNNTALPYTGSVISTDCDYQVNGNQGCATRDNSNSTAATTGAPFAAQGGGVFATLWDANGIQTWFFPRSSIPSDITSGSPDPDSWGAPAASWPSTTCDMDEYFTEQNIIINITLCGAWAGNAVEFAKTCSGLCTDYIADPANFDNAYFELASIKTYSGGRTTATITNSTQEANTATNVSGTVGSAGKSSTQPSGGASSTSANLLTAAAAGLAALAVL